MSAPARGVYRLELEDGTSHQIVAPSKTATASHLFKALKSRRKGLKTAPLKKIVRTG